MRQYKNIESSPNVIALILRKLSVGLSAKKNLDVSAVSINPITAHAIMNRGLNR